MSEKAAPALLLALQVLISALLTSVRLILSGNFARILHGTFDSTSRESDVSLAIRVTITVAVTLAIYGHLAKHHRVSFARAGTGVAVVVTLVDLLAAYFNPQVQAFRPLFLLGLVASNFGLMYIAGRLSDISRRKATQLIE